MTKTTTLTKSQTIVDYAKIEEVRKLTNKAKVAYGGMNYCMFDCLTANFNGDTKFAKWYPDTQIKPELDRFAELYQQAVLGFEALNRAEQAVYRESYGHPNHTIRKVMESAYMHSES